MWEENSAVILPVEVQVCALPLSPTFDIMSEFHGQQLLKGGPASPGAHKPSPASPFWEKAEHAGNS